MIQILIKQSAQVNVSHGLKKVVYWFTYVLALLGFIYALRAEWNENLFPHSWLTIWHNPYQATPTMTIWALGGFFQFRVLPNIYLVGLKRWPWFSACFAFQMSGWVKRKIQFVEIIFFNVGPSPINCVVWILFKL